MDQEQRRDTATARRLRNAATPMERLLWSHLSNRQVEGAKFSRQMPVGPYFADFLCREKRLIVEIDGFSHDGRVGQDLRRDAYLRRAGYRVLRFSNEDVRTRLEGVIAQVAAALLNHAHPQPLPQAGGERVAHDLPSRTGFPSKYYFDGAHREGSGVGL